MELQAPLMRTIGWRQSIISGSYSLFLWCLGPRLSISCSLIPRSLLLPPVQRMNFKTLARPRLHLAMAGQIGEGRVRKLYRELQRERARKG